MVTPVFPWLLELPVAAPDSSRESGSRWLAISLSGYLQAHDLCWLCVVSVVHSCPGLPRLRACRRCLGMDRGYAAQLGLRHLLPVFDWPSPPVIDAKRAGALDGWSREVGRWVGGLR